VYEIQATGNRRATWLVRETGARWQVRNAAASETRDGLEVGPITNPWTRRRMIVIAPLAARPETWVHSLRNVNRARVGDMNDGKLTIEVLEALGPAEVEVRAPRAPKAVRGALNWEMKGDRLVLKTAEAAIIQVEFA